MEKCSYCGITEKDGAPDLGIPYPEIKQRSQFNDEKMCEDCFANEMVPAGWNENKGRGLE